ncbi:MAG: dipeptide ABC transporter ATP-binding protein DppD [Rhodospirillaceae bacterium]|nr:dipeptide ABC transporter ATP-binding protein DppD [Rhodospirillaceae bacterium]
MRKKSSNAAPNLLTVSDLRVKFVTPDYSVHAVNNVSFSLKRGEVLSVLGESGSGKSVTLSAIQRLLPENITSVDGSIKINDEEILSMSAKRLNRLRGKQISMIFQEPATSFDPVFSIGQQITECMRHHAGFSLRKANKRALELLDLVRIPSAKDRLNNYPHELSGGMRQRAMIALALSCDPMILLADEPTTALDATVQIQILLLLKDIQQELGLSIIFVTHDIGVAIEIGDRIAVMYGGQIVETGSLSDVIKDPQHPYTKGLLSSTIHANSSGKRLHAIPGSPPNLSTAPMNCSFSERCQFANETCKTTIPENVMLGPERYSRCLRIGAWA